MIEFIASFLLFTVLQSVFINGIYLSMEGKETIDHNGEVKGKGDVLYPIKRYFSQSRKEIHLLTLEAFKKVQAYAELKYVTRLPEVNFGTFGDIAAIEVTEANRKFVIGLLESLKLNEGFKFGLASEWMQFHKVEGKEFYVLYKEEVKYKFNSWVRKSVGMSCIKCAASFYSLITFIPTFIYIFGFRWEILPLFVFNIFSLVYINYFLYKL